MRRTYFLVAIAATAALASTPAAAQAADDWSGFYIGAQATGSQDRIRVEGDVIFTTSLNATNTPGGPATITISGTGALPIAVADRNTGITGGGFAGYQRQIGKVVIGVEGDFAPFRRSLGATQIHTLIETQVPPDNFSIRRDVRVDAQWSVRARLGYAFGKTMIYATGGYARTNAQVTSTDTFTNTGGAIACTAPPCRFVIPVGPIITTARESKGLSGWTAGGGLEQKIGKSISIGIDYRRTDMKRMFALSNQTIVNNTPASPVQPGSGGLATEPNRVKLTSNALNVRIAFHF